MSSAVPLPSAPPPSPAPPVRFKVNSVASNVVIGVSLVPALPLLAGVFTWGEAGRVGLAVAAGAGFLAIIIAAGLLARRLSREIEVTDEAVREHGRGGQLVEIRWDEPHQLHHEEHEVRRTGVTVAGLSRVRIEAGGRVIKFSANAQRGAIGLAAKAAGGKELYAADEPIARMKRLSAAASAPGASGRA